MIAFKRILFPVDFSGQCTATVPAVKALAKRFNSEVVLLHVVDLPATWFGSPEAASWAALINAERMREEGRIALDRFTARTFTGTPVIAEVDEGEAGQVIVDHAHDDYADLMEPERQAPGWVRPAAGSAHWQARPGRRQGRRRRRRSIRQRDSSAQPFVPAAAAWAPPLARTDSVMLAGRGFGRSMRPMSGRTTRKCRK